MFSVRHRNWNLLRKLWQNKQKNIIELKTTTGFSIHSYNPAFLNLVEAMKITVPLHASPQQAQQQYV